MNTRASGKSPRQKGRNLRSRGLSPRQLERNPRAVKPPELPLERAGKPYRKGKKPSPKALEAWASRLLRADAAKTRADRVANLKRKLEPLEYFLEAPGKPVYRYREMLVEIEMLKREISALQ